MCKGLKTSIHKFFCMSSITVKNYFFFALTHSLREADTSAREVGPSVRQADTSAFSTSDT